VVSASDGTWLELMEGTTVRLRLKNWVKSTLLPVDCRRLRSDEEDGAAQMYRSRMAVVSEALPANCVVCARNARALSRCRRAC